MALIARNHPPYDPPAPASVQSIAGQEPIGAESSARPSPINQTPRLFTRETAQPENNYE